MGSASKTRNNLHRWDTPHGGHHGAISQMAFLLILLLFGFGSPAQAQVEAGAAPGANPADVSSVDAIVAAVKEAGLTT